MNRLPILFLGIFLTFISAWIGLIMIPYLSIGRMTPVLNEETNEQSPPALSGLAEYGRRVYAANGCLYCHTQQVRGEGQGSDLERGWGVRRTVARDYIHEKPVFLGTMRTGPDLSNIGRRQPSASWHHLHLYDPQLLSPGSTMAPFRYLYKKQKITGYPTPDALRFPVRNYVEEGYEIVPTYEARALVAYLLSLDRSYPLPEAPTE